MKLEAGFVQLTGDVSDSAPACVTIRDIDGLTHSVDVTAATLLKPSLRASLRSDATSGLQAFQVD
jgi:hypothetical protein